jgi:hypothetical protein
MAVSRAATLVYADKIDHAFDRKRGNASGSVDSANPTPSASPTAGVWVEPELRAEIKYRANLLRERIHSIAAYANTDSR